MVVELLIHACNIDIHIRMFRLHARNAFRRGNQIDELCAKRPNITAFEENIFLSPPS